MQDEARAADNTGSSSVRHPVGIDDGAREILRRFLRQIVADSDRTLPMLERPVHFGR
jgi:hypothetical protein